MSDPNLHWDGTQWLRWNGEQWEPDPTVAPPKPEKSGHTGVIVAAVAVVAVLVLLIAGGGFWLLTSRDDDQPTAGPATPAGTTIVTMPIEATQESFTDPVGTGQKVTAKTLQQPLTVPGSQPGLYGGTRDVSSCDKRQLVAFLIADPAKAQAWAGVLGITAQDIPGFVEKLTPLLLRSDTLVSNHDYVDGQARPFVSVLQAGTAVLVGRRGLPVVRCYCGNPLTPPPGQVTGATYTGDTWPGWSPQSITVVAQNPTLIDAFSVVDVVTGDTFMRPAGTSGGSDSAGVSNPSSSPTPRATSGGTSAQVEDVIGFLNAIQAGDYSAADSFTTSAFRAQHGGAAGVASGMGALQDFVIDGSNLGDTFVAVYTEEYWDGGTRRGTYYVTRTGDTYIDGADFVDTTGEDIPQDPVDDYPEQYPDNGDLTTPDDDAEYPTDYPEQYPDEAETTDGAVG